MLFTLVIQANLSWGVWVGSFLLLALILLIKSYPITHVCSSCFEPPSSQCIFHSPYLPAPNSGAHWSLKLIWGGGSRRAVWERSWISTFNGIWRLGKNSLKAKKTCGLYFVTALTTVTAFALYDCVGYRSDYGLVLWVIERHGSWLRLMVGLIPYSVSYFIWIWILVAIKLWMRISDEFHEIHIRFNAENNVAVVHQ